MKEATGELNFTVVIVIAIGAMAAFFYFTIWPLIRNNMDANTKCSAAICAKCPKGSFCQTTECYLKDNPSAKFECVWKG